MLAARTYALSAIAAGPRKACDCHVDDGRGPYSDQVFSGWSKQSGAMGERWVAAVNATHASPTTGMAILYEGQPIRAFYSSSSGGATQASVDQWGGDLPYVRSGADPWSLSEENPNRSWTVTSIRPVWPNFSATAVQQVDVIARDPSGVAKTVQATLVDGTTVTKTGNQVRNALGLKSSYINAIDGRAGVPISVPQAPPAQTPPAQAPVEQPVVNYERQVTMLTPADREVRAGAFTIRAQVSPERKDRVWSNASSMASGSRSRRSEHVAAARFATAFRRRGRPTRLRNIELSWCARSSPSAWGMSSGYPLFPASNRARSH